MAIFASATATAAAFTQLFPARAGRTRALVQNAGAAALACYVQQGDQPGNSDLGIVATSINNAGHNGAPLEFFGPGAVWVRAATTSVIVLGLDE